MSSHKIWLMRLLMAVVFLGAVAFSIEFGRQLAVAMRVREECISQSRFAQISSMLLSYHQEHGAFPPTRYQAKPGGPVHSWRVLLAPYIDAYFRERFSRYDFSQEWNSPGNLEALAGMGDYFSKGGNDITNYLAIGDEDDWPSRGPLKSILVSKGKDRFLLVEYPASYIHWMEPRY